MKSTNQNRPNILLVMADQIAAPALPVYGHPIVKTPHLESLASSGVVFDAAYCNFPVCGPSRFSMMTGLYATRVGAYDNAAEFSASWVTLPHYLRALGYHTSLCGKMHFIGPDQLHGYHERLTTDIIGADFALTADWSETVPSSPAGATLKTVLDAGHCIRSLQIDYDDEVEHCAIQKIHDLARTQEQQPFFLTVSFTHPHAPFTAPLEHWQRYRDEDIDMPAVGPLAEAEQDMQTRWLEQARRSDQYVITDDLVRNARHAYYGMISYIDDKVGRIMEAMRQTELDRNTVVIFVGDHGEMMGERGMWFKSTFYEWSCRVPMIVSAPGRYAPRRCPQVVSLIDLLPTLLDLGSTGTKQEYVDEPDGTSLVPLLEGKVPEAWNDLVLSEYTADGVLAPCRMARQGPYKYIYVHGHGSQLYHMGDDPHELHNLSGQKSVADVEQRLLAHVLKDWDPDKVTADILRSQRRRLFIQKVTAGAGMPVNWSFKARFDDDTRYVRSAKASDIKARKRFPYVAPKN
ncbi:MAG: choline-sulfatase [Burkholderiales bacterium]|nr:choline-sulfatase [Burkholderiales bacterium]